MIDLSIGRLSIVRVVSGVLLAMALALVWAGAAHAQSAGDQYGIPVSPSGPAAGLPVTVQGDTNGIVGPGDVLIIEGDYVIADGASVTLQDSDGTQGTLIDGQNATIVEGSIIITVTDNPIINVPGANGVLNTDGLFVVATTGISAADEGASTGDNGAANNGAANNGGDDGAVADASGNGNGTAAAAAGGGSEAQPTSAVTGVLPDTGGPVLFGLLGGVALIGGGLLAIRRRLTSGE